MAEAGTRVQSRCHKLSAAASCVPCVATRAMRASAPPKRKSDRQCKRAEYIAFTVGRPTQHCDGAKSPPPPPVDVPLQTALCCHKGYACNSSLPRDVLETGLQGDRQPRQDRELLAVYQLHVIRSKACRLWCATRAKTLAPTNGTRTWCPSNKSSI